MTFEPHTSSGTMAGLEVVTTAIERTKMDSPTSNASDCTLRTNTSFSSQSQTSSGFHSQGGALDGTVIETETQHGSLETLNTSFHEFDCAERYPRLVELGRAPWTDDQVEQVLQNCEELTKQSRAISYSAVQRLSYLLQRPLIRIVREARRLSHTYGKCTKHDITAAARIVLSYQLAESCLKATTKALSSYQMNCGIFKQCKRKRAGLTLSVGQFFRWMIDAKVGAAIDDHAAVCLTACVEQLVVEIVRRASLIYVGKDSKEFTMEMLELGVSDDAETWGLLQPFEHLICGRNASGLVIFPSCISAPKMSEVADHSLQECEHSVLQGIEASRQLEQSIMVTCVGSISELGELVARATHYLQQFQKVSSSYNQHSQMAWSSSALQTLYHFMKCNQLENQSVSSDHHQHIIQLTPERSFVVLPPLLEWMRVASTHCLHRFGSSIDADDVLQAARVLLPGMDCPVRSLRCSDTTSLVRDLDSEKSAARFKRNLGFQMLQSGRADLVAHATQLLGADGLNTINEQGLTPLMTACLQGDEGMAQILLQSGALPDVMVPSNLQKFPGIHPAIRHWTALSFAMSHKNTALTQLLLEAGASVEGSVEIHGDNYTHSPLQLASAAGHLEQVCLLLSKGADPYMTTSQNDCFSSKGYNNSFALAAAHGHRGVLRKLLEQPHSRRSSDILSLEEMLAEGADEEPRRRERKTNKATKNKMSAALQEAMYHSCEHGFLDIVMELRSLGIPWTLHCWTETLKINRQLHRRANLQCLLRDFTSIKLDEDWEEFTGDGLVLMFEIFRYSRDEVVSRQLASIFSSLYGNPDLPVIEVPQSKQMARIDPQFVNNPDMSDVTFIVEGQPFYAHKIVLVTASKRFKGLLSEARNADGGIGGGKLPSIEISDIKYHIFKLVMEFLYHGNVEKLQVPSKDILELLAAASFFAVSGLVLYCSQLCTQKLTPETAPTIYRHARMYNALALLNYCHAYFLANFNDLLNLNDSFRKLLRGNRPHDQDTLSMLQAILSVRVRETYGMKNTSV